MTNKIIFASIKNAISLEKTINKGCASLVVDFVGDITTNDAATIKNALKKALKEAGFIPSNAFSMKAFNTAAAIAAAGIAADDAAAVMSLLKVKAAHGEKMTAATIAAAVEKHGDIVAVVTAAKKAATPAAKKAAATNAAKKGAQTRAAKKGGIVPKAVRNAAIAADSVKNTESPLFSTAAATPAARLDRAVNCFLALTDDERIAFYNAVRKELKMAVLTASKAKAKKEKAA